MKIKLLVKKIKHKIIKFLYEYFKKIYIRKVEISPDNWIMAVSADSTELLLLSCDYNIKWEQVSCLKGIRLEDVTPELDSKAYAELKNNKH